MTATVHHAGPVVGGVQRCLRCGVPLVPVRTVGGLRIFPWPADTLVAMLPSPAGVATYVLEARLPAPNEALCAPREEGV